MYLKSIEVNGFKSFANKLVFEFKDGITGIVGPNGSGKSNVADAVRWVLGEQSAKQLRGSKMEDVIFAGTQNRRAMGFAYVAITFDNSDKALDIDFDEVTVARRVYRSGESEYLINGNTCLLKDIKEMFFDTGIGKEGYSIIGQGQIDKILSGKPEDRRELFDEAAGIVKYKKRKAETVKNLEAERTNLVRINDILSELEIQVGPLKKQSEKARKFLDYREELKSLDIKMFVMDYKRLNEELDEVKSKHDTAAADLELANYEYAKSRDSIDDLEENIKSNAEDIENSNNTVNNNRVKIQQLDGEVKLFEQQIMSLSDSELQFEEKIEQLHNILDKYNEEREALVKEKNENEQKLSICEAEKAAKDKEIGELFAAIKDTEDKIFDCNEQIVNIRNNSSEIKSEQKKYETMLEQNAIKKAEMNNNLFRLKGVVSDSEAFLKEIEKQAESGKNDIADINEHTKALRYKLHENERLYREEENIYINRQKALMEINSELNTLKNMSERYEGYGVSIKKIMEQKVSNKGIIGVVSDIISVDKKYETAIEIALGGNIQNIITDTKETAKELVEYLKKGRYGRATFLPISDITADADYNSELDDEPGVLGPVSDYAKTDDKYKEVIKYLMGRFVLVDNIDNALKLAKKYRYTLRIVTLEGEFLNVGGSISGGAFKNKSNLLSRKREIDELTEKKDGLSSELEAIKEKLSQMSDEHVILSNNIKASEDNRQKLEIEYNTIKLKYEHALEESEKAVNEYNGAKEATGLIESEKNDLVAMLDKLQSGLSDNEKKFDETKTLSEELSVYLEELKANRAGMHDIINQLNLDKLALVQKIEFISENLSRVLESISQTEGELKAADISKHTTRDDILKRSDDIEAVKAAIENMSKYTDELNLKIEQLKVKQEELNILRKRLHDEREQIANKRNELEKEQIRIANQSEKLTAQFDSLTLYMWNEYELTYRSVKDTDVTTDMSYSALKSEVGELKRKIKALGDVNVNSIEEYISVSERYNTMKEQHDDIIESEKRLLAFIEELEIKMCDRFTSEFEKINEQYNIVFRELFGGGRGMLELTDKDDILDSGIRIIAEPPGKSLKSVSMLSGGEKALSAIAILFAIQNLKPSPFCLLDEIEAALDDSNVKRFAGYLKKLKKDSQYIVITHRQGTMEAADTLYGITMQEKGISTLVSVDLVEQQL